MYATLKLHQKCGTDVWTDNWQYLQIGLANIVLFLLILFYIHWTRWLFIRFALLMAIMMMMMSHFLVWLICVEASGGLVKCFFENMRKFFLN